MDTTMSLHALKRLYQDDFKSVVAEVCEDDTNASNL